MWTSDHQRSTCCHEIALVMSWHYRKTLIPPNFKLSRALCKKKDTLLTTCSPVSGTTCDVFTCYDSGFLFSSNNEVQTILIVCLPLCVCWLAAQEVSHPLSLAESSVPDPPPTRQSFDYVFQSLENNDETACFCPLGHTVSISP